MKEKTKMEEKTVLFQITPEQRFKNALNALAALDCDYEITFRAVKYVRHVDRDYYGGRPAKV